MSLIEEYLNDRCTYTMGKEYLTPYIFQINGLKRAKKSIWEGPLLDQFFFPSTQLVRQAVLLLGADSRDLLSNLVTELSSRVLNFKNTSKSDKPDIGQLIIVPDRLKRQQFPSLISALGRVIKKTGLGYFYQNVGWSYIGSP